MNSTEITPAAKVLGRRPASAPDRRIPSERSWGTLPPRNRWAGFSCGYESKEPNKKLLVNGCWFPWLVISQGRFWPIPMACFGVFNGLLGWVEWDLAEMRIERAKTGIDGNQQKWGQYHGFVQKGIPKTAIEKPRKNDRWTMVGWPGWLNRRMRWSVASLGLLR